ncbi:hypothetical protein [Aquitalea sp. ASV15]|uniref:hypothetical protein n=1 Tax=Aquitalea sp. ASV15 TaxID=2795104 RepID=UPI0018EBAA25|nr:hypothetical protein [Aquitalea sp. ASV15]
MKTIRFGVTYGASPVFYPDVDHVGYVEIEDLGLSFELKKEINEWNEVCQDAFCEEYPPDSGFKNIADAILHNKRGETLASKIEEESGGRLRVQFLAI